MDLRTPRSCAPWYLARRFDFFDRRRSSGKSNRHLGVFIGFENGNIIYKSGDFPYKSGDFPYKSGDFPSSIGDFP